MTCTLVTVEERGYLCVVCRHRLEPGTVAWRVAGESGGFAYVEASCTGDYGCSIIHAAVVRETGEDKPKLSEETRWLCSFLQHLGSLDLNTLEEAP